MARGARGAARPLSLALLPELLVLVACLVGAGLRLVRLADVPPALQQDEAINGYDAYSLLRTGRDHLGHPFPFAGLESFGDWVSPLLTFLTVPAVGLLGLRPEALRAVSAVVGVLAIPLLYLLGRELPGRRSTGVLAAWLVAVSPWHVLLSRWAIPPSLVPTMVTLTLLALIRALRCRGDRGIVAAALVLGLTVASYPTMKLYAPLLGLAALLIYRQALARLSREALVYAALLFVALAGPILYLSIADPGGRARFEQVSVLQDGNPGAAFLARQYLSYFSHRFLVVAGDGDPMHAPPGAGVELRSLLPLMLVGLLRLVAGAARPVSGQDRRVALLVLVALALAPVPGSLTRPSPDALRAAQFIPLLALLAAAGAVALAERTRWLLGWWLGRARPAVAWGALVLLCVLAALPAGLEVLGRHERYFTSYPRQVAPHFQYGLGEAVGYARAREGEYGEVWFTDDIRAAYAYVLFYTAWPPSDAHRELRVRRAPPEFNQAESLGPYRFGEPPGLRREDLPLLHTVRDPTGRVAYLIRGGAAPTGARILLVHPP